MTDDERQERQDELLDMTTQGVQFGLTLWNFCLIGSVVAGIGFAVAFAAFLIWLSSR